MPCNYCERDAMWLLFRSKSTSEVLNTEPKPLCDKHLTFDMACVLAHLLVVGDSLTFIVRRITDDAQTRAETEAVQLQAREDAQTMLALMRSR